MDEELDEPLPFRGEVVFSHIGEDVGPETSKSNMIPTYKSSQANTADMVAIKTESLSHAKAISSEEFSILLAMIGKTELVNLINLLRDMTFLIIRFLVLSEITQLY